MSDLTVFEFGMLTDELKYIKCKVSQDKQAVLDYMGTMTEKLGDDGAILIEKNYQLVSTTQHTFKG